MTRRILDYNPLTGQTVNFEYVHSQNKIVITHEQNVDDILRVTKAMQNDEDRTKKGIAADMWHYAKIPESILLKIKQDHGIDFKSREDFPRLLTVINSEYPHFKTTSKHHSIKHA